MKKLSAEEKARAYDKALQVLHKYDGANIMFSQSLKEEMFPELKESEDERIRKWLIALIKSNEYGSISNVGEMPCPKLNVLAWLEKQKAVDILDEEEREFADNVDSYRKEVDAAYQKGYDEGVKSTLEKQGESSIYNTPSREVILAVWDLGNEWKGLTGGSISTKYDTQLTYIQKHWQESEYFLRAKQSEQKPADKVEPKFHDGEWITHNTANFVFKIINVGYNGYEVVNRENYKKTISFDNEYNYHLWTIEDAKDGDVLAFDNTLSGYHSIGIFKRLATNREVWGNTYRCYVKYGGFKEEYELEIAENNSELHHCGTSVCPSTKEQRDLLFSKMREAGYEWDAEKKELKKIDWDPQPGDIFRKKGTIFPTYHLCSKRENGITFGFVDNRENGISGGEITIFALRNDYELVERLKPMGNMIKEEFNKVVSPNDVWSEEDERTIKRIDSLLYAINESDFEDIRAWLESLKDRVQPKQEWSEEDSSNLQCCIAKVQLDINNGNIGRNRELLTWLKSLRPQPKQEWSEEDEKMINHIIIDIGSLKEQVYCKTLCDEEIVWLKSLKERALPQPKQEWSGEDEKCLRLSTGIIDSALRAGLCVQLNRDRCVDWLESLRPQNRWISIDKEVYVKEPVLAQKKDKSDPFNGFVVCCDHTLVPDIYERYARLDNNYSQNI